MTDDELILKVFNLEDMMNGKKVDFDDLRRLVQLVHSQEVKNASGKTVTDWVQEIGAWAKRKGWWDKPRSALEVHMLMVSEIVEATEEVRRNTLPDYEAGGKPEGEAVELVDCMIRIMEYFAYKKSWNLEALLQKKIAYNEQRPYRHGDKAH